MKASGRPLLIAAACVLVLAPTVAAVALPVLSRADSVVTPVSGRAAASPAAVTVAPLVGAPSPDVRSLTSEEPLCPADAASAQGDGLVIDSGAGVRGGAAAPVPTDDGTQDGSADTDPVASDPGTDQGC